MKPWTGIELAEAYVMQAEARQRLLTDNIPAGTKHDGYIYAR